MGTRELTRKELQLQLDAERACSDALAKRIAAMERANLENVGLPRSGTITELVYGEFKSFEEWRDEGIASGYKHPVRTNGVWEFIADGGMRSVLGGWDAVQKRGYFIQRRAL